jgi:hypothetical protein
LRGRTMSSNRQMSGLACSRARTRVT